MIEVQDLSKRYGRKVAVEGLYFTARPGQVTGFLGPNGAGKSTTMRMMLDLDRPSGGRVLIHGRQYVRLPDPLRQVGAVLEGKATHGGRSAYHHLLWLTQSNHIPRPRVREVLHLVGLEGVMGQRVGGFSLGMAQRPAIAVALLGDPPVLLFDEPLNGLDPEGIRWLRDLMKALAAEGRTVFVSSHLMAEMALTAEHLVVIAKGRLIADTTVRELVDADSYVRIRTPEPERLRDALARTGIRVESARGGALHAHGAQPATIGDTATANGIPVHEISVQTGSLEEVFLRLTGDAGPKSAGGAL